MRPVSQTGTSPRQPAVGSELAQKRSFGLGLVGVAVGAAIGADTSMWWMMSVVGGIFANFVPLIGRRAD